jgi:hypothetical protein
MDENERIENLIKATVNFCGNEVLAAGFIRAGKKWLDEKCWDLQCIPPLRLKNLKEKNAQIYVHSPLSFIQECILYKREINKETLLKLFFEKTCYPRSSNSNVIVDIISSEVFKDYFDSMIALAKATLIWEGCYGDGKEAARKEALDSLYEERSGSMHDLRQLLESK